MDINKYVPKFRLKSKDLMHVADLSAEEIYELLYTAKLMKKKLKAGETVTLLRGKTVGLLFGDVSTRTRISFELGIRQMGGDYLFLPKDETQLSRGESIRDTAALLKRYGLSAIVLRAFNDAELEDFSSHSEIPVINGLSDRSHPLHVLSDLFTIWEKKGSLDDLRLAYIGDGNNVTNSLIIGCTKCSMNISVASPSGHKPEQSVVERAMQFGDVLITDSVEEAVSGADIVYTDAFLPADGEDPQATREKFEKYRITPEVMALAKPDALFMHRMPVRRGEEVAAKVADGPQSVIYDQAENRLHLNKAALALLLAGETK